MMDLYIGMRTKNATQANIIEVEQKFDDTISKLRQSSPTFPYDKLDKKQRKDRESKHSSHESSPVLIRDTEDSSEYLFPKQASLGSGDQTKELSAFQKMFKKTPKKELKKSTTESFGLTETLNQSNISIDQSKLSSKSVMDNIEEMRNKDPARLSFIQLGVDLYGN